MKKIVWISSYPKSGNTWMRYLLGNYFFNNKNRFDHEIISNIKKFQIDKNIITNNLNIDLKKNPFNISKYWIESQEKLKIINGNIAFLKTHNALINVNQNEFTNENISLAIIHIVRDPRDVTISYAKYRNLEIDQTIENLISDKLVYNQDINNSWDIEILGSWSFNYLSWKNGIPNIPRVLVRYEDLVRNCEKTFSKVIKFLSDHMNFNADLERVKLSVDLSKFENMKNYENSNNFKENKGSSDFFRTGTYGNWKTDLNQHQIKKIEINLKSEMKELNYL